MTHTKAPLTAGDPADHLPVSHRNTGHLKCQGHPTPRIGNEAIWLYANLSVSPAQSTQETPCI